MSMQREIMELRQQVNDIAIRLDTLLSADVNTNISRAIPSLIKNVVSENTGVQIRAMHTRTRRREVVEARQMAMSMMAKHTNLGLKAIGEQFGTYDHSTVIHARETINDLIINDKRLKNIYDICDARITKLIYENNLRIQQGAGM